jgi:hypothetical protein
VVSAGLLKLHHGDATGCSYRGRQYRRDENGDVLVPAEASFELLAHGFAPVVPRVTPVPGRAEPIPADR